MDNRRASRMVECAPGQWIDSRLTLTDGLVIEQPLGWMVFAPFDGSGRAVVLTEDRSIRAVAEIDVALMRLRQGPPVMVGFASTGRLDGMIARPLILGMGWDYVAQTTTWTWRSVVEAASDHELACVQILANRPARGRRRPDVLSAAGYVVAQGASTVFTAWVDPATGQFCGLTGAGSGRHTTHDRGAQLVRRGPGGDWTPRLEEGDVEADKEVGLNLVKPQWLDRMLLAHAFSEAALGL